MPDTNQTEMLDAATAKAIDAAQNEINACKILLLDTDYQAMKHADGALTDEDYADTKAKRQQWRDRINELEAEQVRLISAESEGQ